MAHTNLGVALARKKLYDEAITEYREAIRIDPNSGTAYLNLAEALRSKGLHEEAIGEFQRAIAVDPANHLARNNFGAFLCDCKRDYDGAIVQFKEAIRIEPGFPHAYKNLGIALSKKGLWDQAIPEFKKAIEIKPDYADAYNGLGIAHRFQKRFDEAIDAFRKATLLEPNPGFYCNLAAVIEMQGMVDQAIVTLREAYRLDPQYPQARDRLPRALERRAWDLANSADPKGRDPKRAIELAAEAVRIAPNQSAYSFTLGVAQYQSGKWNAAIDAHQRAIGLRHPNAPDAGFTEFYLAMAYWKLGDRPEASKWYDKAVEWMDKNKPDDKGLRRFRAQAAELLGVETKKD